MRRFTNYPMGNRWRCCAFIRCVIPLVPFMFISRHSKLCFFPAVVKQAPVSSIFRYLPIGSLMAQRIAGKRSINATRVLLVNEAPGGGNWTGLAA